MGGCIPCKLYKERKIGYFTKQCFEKLCFVHKHLAICCQNAQQCLAYYVQYEHYFTVFDVA